MSITTIIPLKPVIRKKQPLKFGCTIEIVVKGVSNLEEYKRNLQQLADSQYLETLTYNASISVLLQEIAKNLVFLEEP